MQVQFTSIIIIMWESSLEFDIIEKVHQSTCCQAVCLFWHWINYNGNGEQLYSAHREGNLVHSSTPEHIPRF